MSRLKEALKVQIAQNGSIRGTGRTHGMLLHALSAAISGAVVYVVGPDIPGLKRMIQHVQGLEQFKRLGPNVHISFQAHDIQLPHPMGQMRFRHMDDPTWDWNSMHFKGIPMNVPVYVDHTVGERKLEQLEDEERKAAKE